MQRCLVYIDLNMVRAGVVKHSADWTHGGYREIQNPPERYTLIDLVDLSASCGFTNIMHFQQAHRQWVEEALARESMRRVARWSEAIAVGGYDFVEKIKRELGSKAVHRDVEEAGGAHSLREQQGVYTSDFGAENAMLRQENFVPWIENPLVSER